MNTVLINNGFTRIKGTKMNHARAILGSLFLEMSRSTFLTAILDKLISKLGLYIKISSLVDHSVQSYHFGK